MAVGFYLRGGEKAGKKLPSKFMLARKYKLKKDNDFKKVFKRGENYQRGLIRLKAVKNDLLISRFGFIISNKLSKKAVVRNKVKRKLEEITRLNLDKVKTGFDIIVMVSPLIKEKDYQEIEKSLTSLLKEIN